MSLEAFYLAVVLAASLVLFYKAWIRIDITALLVEPVLGEGGIVIPDPGYLTALRAICDEHGWLMMLDEIQTGNGRTGKYFAYQHTDVLPDVVTTAKGLGNGVAIAGVVGRAEIIDVISANSISTLPAEDSTSAAENRRPRRRLWTPRRGSTDRAAAR